ncbi:alkaline phosphatase family protein [Pelagicoccus sp. NFK12]|uniref:Alkaline phosphatase family protein n=1 Tax=Pelagicoccus enzymogenes TaxID=2773457 RepID=A0A927FDT7_9BACT|nr:nucleotide pyrophosphatase/phosphodiesterase family protein [Pelagicoccus enzymogenes]MBD5781956.1 alkaline phosphatase family protein [Pelagicoccus enzymogenes]
MQRLAVINVVGLTQGLIGPHTPRIQKHATAHNSAYVKPAFPAVTCTAQSDYLTGTTASQHGIVANGWYNRDYSEIQFWKQSNHLVQQPKLWEKLRDANPGFTTAKLFWWYNMYSSAEYTITPRPMYPADGRKVFDVYTQPMGMREEIKSDLGDFPFFTFWGPKAGIPCSQWIAKSAQWVEEKHSPDLNLVYLPHLDYNLQRLGPIHPDIAQDLQEIDTVVGELLDFFESRNVQVVLLSEYGITQVETPIHINRALREKGWITVKDELGLEQLDAGASKAFAVADHQVAHIYLNDPQLEPQVREAVAALPGVAQVLDRQQQADAGIAHERSGDLIAVSQENAWFTYYYWLDDALAPDFARTIDIHRKAGYDPVELFIDPKIKFPPAKIAKFLLKKKLGFRALLDVIPLDATLVKGSHGTCPKNRSDWPVYISPQNLPDQLTSPQVHHQLLAHFQR